MIMRTVIILLFLSFTLISYSQNILTNGDLEAGMSNWTSWFDGSTGYTGNFSIETSDVNSGAQSGKVLITGIGTAAEYHKIMVKNTGFSLQANKEYAVSFYIRCSKAGQTFQSQVHKDASPYTSYASQYFTTSTSWQQYSYSFTSPVSTSDVRFALKMGGSIANYYFDDVVISEVSGPSYPVVIDPNYSIDWSTAGRPGGIPNVPNVLNVTNYGAAGNGTTNDLTAFQNAVNAANSGQAVYVPAGTYLLNGTLDMKQGVVLRGECPTNTRLLFNNNGASVSCIDVLTYQYGTFVNVTNGLNKGSNVFTVTNASAFNVGGYAEIQQDNDPALMYTNPTWNQSWAQQAVGQLLRVTAKNGNQITVDRGLHMNFNPALNPQIRPIGLITDVGIENLYIERLDAGDGHTIQIRNAARCWVKNIESNMTYRTHVSLSRAVDCEVINSYMHHSHDYGGGGHGYGVDLIGHSTSNLIENNIFERLRHAMMAHVGSNGNVFGYNYSTDPFWSNSNSNLPPDISIHGHYSFMNLFEGNIVQEANYSDYWGPAGPGNTMFRNRVETDNIYVMDHSHNSNVIANELTANGAVIEVHPTVNNTWKHSNNINGVIDASTSAALPASLYKSSKPDFLDGLEYPTFGPDVTLGANTIDAKQRFVDGNPMLACACNPQMDCYPVGGGAVQVNLKLYLEGAFDAGSLKNDLYTRGLLPGQTPASNVPPTPSGHPYSQAPWNHTGTEGQNFSDSDYANLDNGTISPVDWVLVDFRSSTNEGSSVGKICGILLTDGSIELLNDPSFFNGFPSSVYIKVEHRNHLPVMSNGAVPFTNGVLTFDFTAADTYTNGGVGSYEILSGVWTMYAGNCEQAQDLNGYDINGLDNQIWSVDNGQFSKYLATDINLDGEVSAADKILWSINNGYFSTVE